jgi:hypothetical protein
VRPDINVVTEPNVGAIEPKPPRTETKPNQSDDSLALWSDRSTGQSASWLWGNRLA